jgi:hypothetical protein
MRLFLSFTLLITTMGCANNPSTKDFDKIVTASSISSDDLQNITENRPVKYHGKFQVAGFE